MPLSTSRKVTYYDRAKRLIAEHRLGYEQAHHLMQTAIALDGRTPVNLHPDVRAVSELTAAEQSALGVAMSALNAPL